MWPANSTAAPMPFLSPKPPIENDHVPGCRWLASVMAFVVPVARLQDLAALALVLGNIVFGVWLTYCEWRRKDG
jgi:hypothetical protein